MGKKVQDLVKVYQDLEKTIKSLKHVSEESATALRQIHVGKLIEQLMRSKKRIERKINNKLLLEREELVRRLKVIKENLKQLHH